MAVTQYIGARYVPKFYDNANLTAEWEPNVIYEPLTVVTRNGNSYTSRKEVPASIGAPEFNPEYWVATGLYNDQITELTNRIEMYASQKYIFLGASISLSTSSTLAGGFVDQAIHALGLNPADYVNIAVNGAGFSSGNTFLQQLQTAVSSVSEEFKGCPVRIIVVGGTWNDSTSLTYLDDVDAFVAYAKNVFPRCTCEFVPLSWSKDLTKRIRIKNFSDQYLPQMADHGFVVWWDFYAYMHNYVSWFRDDLHWTQTGINVAARAFTNVIKGVSGDMNPGEGMQTPLAPSGLVDTTNLELPTTWNQIRDYYDGRYIWVTGASTAMILKSGGASLTLPTAVASAFQWMDNPFHYYGASPFTGSDRQWSEIQGYVRNHENTNNTACALFVNDANKLCIYSREAFSLTLHGNLVKFMPIPIPRELC